jgi:hypothetical protein
LPALAELLKNPAAVDGLGGDLACQAQLSLINESTGKNLAFREALARKVKLLHAELAGPAPAPLERLLAERVVTCWLQVNMADVKLAQQEGGMTLAAAEYHQRSRDRAHKRYLSAIKALALVRKLAAPVLQVNLAAAGGEGASAGAAATPGRNGYHNGRVPAGRLP